MNKISFITVSSQYKPCRKRTTANNMVSSQPSFKGIESNANGKIVNALKSLYKNLLKKPKKVTPSLNERLENINTGSVLQSEFEKCKSESSKKSFTARVLEPLEKIEFKTNDERKNFMEKLDPYMGEQNFKSELPYLAYDSNFAKKLPALVKAIDFSKEESLPAARAINTEYPKVINKLISLDEKLRTPRTMTVLLKIREFNFNKPATKAAIKKFNLPKGSIKPDHRHYSEVQNERKNLISILQNKELLSKKEATKKANSIYSFIYEAQGVIKEDLMMKYLERIENKAKYTKK